MKDYLTLEQLIFQNNNYEIEYGYSNYYGTLGPNRKICVNISYCEKYIHIISNPVIVFELDSNLDLEFDLEYVFSNITLEIGGSSIDRLDNKQIQIYNKIYGLEVKKIGSKIFYPIPFECMINGQGILKSKCLLHEIRIYINFSSGEFINLIKNFSIQTKLTITKPDFTISNDYYKKILSEDYHDVIDEKKYSGNQIIRFKFNQFFGLENIILNTHIKIKVCFNHIVDRFFIYFQNQNDKSIYWNTQQFDMIEIIINGLVIKEYDYENLLLENSKEFLGYELPKGVFEIKWSMIESFKNLSRIDTFTIQFYGLMVPPNISFGICAESINYLIYKDNFAGIIYGN